MNNLNCWLIWSNEHNAYWGPGHCGYTKDVDRAGRYNRLEADAICERANRHLPERALPHEIRVSSPELDAAIEKATDDALQHLFNGAVDAPAESVGTATVPKEGAPSLDIHADLPPGEHALYVQPVPAYWTCTVGDETFTTMDHTVALEWASDFPVEAHWSPAPGAHTTIT